MNLLLTPEAKWLGLGIAFFLLMVGISVIVYAIRTAECYEIEEDVPGKDLEPCSYLEIIDCERPYIEYN